LETRLLPEQCRSHPFDTDLARATSAYARFDNSRLVRVLNPERPLSSHQHCVHAAFRAHILEPHFSCVGAKAAVHHGAYRLGVYGEMASAEAIAGVAFDLFHFVREQPNIGCEFTTFAASFEGPKITTEEDFEQQLWAALQALHDLDRAQFSADPNASDDPEAARFGFSFAGRAFFVIGLHPKASRQARQFPWPTLVFNAHFQFDKLKEDGRYAKMQRAIRAREMDWQGSINPMLSDFGERPEARQYSGRAVEQDWRCPFHAHRSDSRASFGGRVSRLEPMARYHLEPQTGIGFLLKRGQRLRIIDPRGEQVSDLTAFAQEDPQEWLSSGRSIDYANTIYLTTGHILYSNRSRPMFTLLEDKVGRHDFLLTPCSPETFKIIYGHDGDHPSCFGNLVKNLAQFGITPDHIPTTFNVFMNVVIAPTGGLTIGPPRSKPGDYLDLRAELDLIVGVTACSAELSNNYSFKPIDVEVYRE